MIRVYNGYFGFLKYVLVPTNGEILGLEIKPNCSTRRRLGDDQYLHRSERPTDLLTSNKFHTSYLGIME